jgi:hypothetical protein
MKSKAQSALNHQQRARSAQLVSFVLLFLITYGSTAVHHHGNLPPQNQTVTVNLATNDGSSSTGDSQRASDCVVCHFQRNLSSTAFFSSSLVMALVTEQAVSSSPIVFYLSTLRIAGRGRAPPFTS